MRVLHVFEIGLTGGAFRVIEALSVAQHRAGLNPAVLAVAEGPALTRHPMLESLRAEGVTVETVVLDRSRAYLRERREVVAAARRLGAGMIHTHGYRADVVDGPAARGAGYPTVTTLHGFTASGVRGRLYEWLQRAAVRRGDAIVAVSQAMRNRLVERGFPADRLHVVPNALLPRDGLLSREEARTALGVALEGFRAGWVGRVSREKGPDLFLEAVRRIDPPVAVSVVGDGAMRPGLEAGAPPWVDWHGVVHAADTLFRAFDVLVLSSRTEGTPMVLLEAMRAGVPVVATAVGGVPAVVSEKEAVLVSPVDPAALAAGIVAVRDHPDDARRRAAAARARLDRHFSPERWVEAYQHVYHRAGERREKVRI